MVKVANENPESDLFLSGFGPTANETRETNSKWASNHVSDLAQMAIG
jgi:hypothetical protein